MIYALDSNVIISILRKRSPVHERLLARVKREAQRGIGIPSVVRAELFYGVLGRADEHA